MVSVDKLNRLGVSYRTIEDKELARKDVCMIIIVLYIYLYSSIVLYMLYKCFNYREKTNNRVYRGIELMGPSCKKNFTDAKR